LGYSPKIPVMKVAGAVLAALALSGCLGSTANSDGSPPQVAIQSPVAGASVNSTVSIDVLAIDDFGVATVRIFIDGEKRADLFTQPYHMLWNTAALADQSTHTIRAEALDAAGNIGTTSISVTVVKGPI